MIFVLDVTLGVSARGSQPAVVFPSRHCVCVYTQVQEDVLGGFIAYVGLHYPITLKSVFLKNTSFPYPYQQSNRSTSFKNMFLESLKFFCDESDSK